jgi:hypothetical protein
MILARKLRTLGLLLKGLRLLPSMNESLNRIESALGCQGNSTPPPQYS